MLFPLDGKRFASAAAELRYRYSHHYLCAPDLGRAWQCSTLAANLHPGQFHGSARDRPRGARRVTLPDFSKPVVAKVSCHMRAFDR